MTPDAEKLALEVLQICNKRSRRTGAGKLIEMDRILQEFGKPEIPGVKSVIKNYLLKMRYLQKLDDSTLILTDRGENYALTNGGGSSLNIGSYSNVAINSPRSTLSISISDQSVEIQELIAKFDDAVKSKDANAMKSAFGYIADKSVDVAIAIATGVLTK